MAGASFQVSSFYGGEWSQTSQGRVEEKEYRTALNVCLNWIITEGGSLTRRPGTVNAGESRSGKQGRSVKFDFEQSAAYTIEFTDGYMRFRAGQRLATTNDAQTVLAISTANPAIVQTQTAHGWASASTVFFSGAGVPTLLQNRRFLITVTDVTHFSIADALTGANIDGSTLSALGTATVSRVQEFTTPYGAGSWGTLRAVQAETNSILLQGTVAPQILQASTLPGPSTDAQFALTGLTFLDGPYLDPVTGGTLASPSAVNGNISLTLSFNAYDATKSYSVGDYATYSSVNYKSLANANVNHQPDINPSFWTPVSSADAIGSNGFSGSDVGRLVRLYSEPPIWDSAATYSAGAVVAYGGTGNQYSGATYWSSLVGSNVGNIPGADLTKWSLLSTGARWTWGRITGLTNIISNTAGTIFGQMIAGGGNAAAFDGIFSKIGSHSAANVYVNSGTPGQVIALASYIGKIFTGTPKQVAQAVAYPSTDLGFGFASINVSDFTVNIVFNLRAKNSVPVSSADGTLLGTFTTLNTLQPVTLISNDQATAWNYVWVEQITYLVIGNFPANFTLNNTIAQLSLFSPPGTGTSQGVTVQIVGDPLLYSSAIRTWRLGLYSNTTGWPTCGTYHEGRIWLGGAAANRFDGSKTNGIVGTTINFAPTDQYGVVSDNNAISAVMNSDGVNPLYWMQPDLQGIICGTLAGEWLIQAPTTGPITPTNIAVRRVTKIGCANVEPRRTDHTNIFVRRYRKKIMEYFSDVFSGKFSAPNISQKAEQIVAKFVAELAYCDAVDPIIWGRCDDGSLFGITYKRDTLATSQGPTFNGFHRHQLGSGRVVESICGGPSTDGNLDTLTIMTNDASTNIRNVELLTDAFDETTALANAWHLDNACNPTTVSSSTAPAGGSSPYGGMTMNGLWYLNGKTVSVFAGGLDCGDFTVANGSLFVPYGDGTSAGSGSGKFTAAFATALPLSQIVVGFTYNSDAQLVRPSAPAEAGSRNGPAFGKTKRSARYAIQTVSSAGLSIGTSFTNMLPIQFKNNAGQAMGVLSTFTGIYRDDLQDNYSYDSMIAVRVSRPLPAIIASIGGFPHTQDI